MADHTQNAVAPSYEDLRALALREITDHDAALEMLLGAERLLAVVKEVKRAVEERVREWCEEGGRQVVLVQEPGKVSPGDVRWYPGVERKVVQRNATTGGTVALWEDALEAVGGDLEELADKLLASSWLKQGAFKTLAGEETWAAHFQRVEVDVLKEGKPTAEQRRLIKESMGFLPPGACQRAVGEVEDELAKQAEEG